MSDFEPNIGASGGVHFDAWAKYYLAGVSYTIHICVAYLSNSTVIRF